jgi:hypothetical protein
MDRLGRVALMDLLMERWITELASPSEPSRRGRL